MLFIKELNPELNTQKDSIRAKLFTWLCVRIFHYDHVFSLLFVSKEFFYIYIRFHFAHHWLDNDVEQTSKGRRFLNF